MQYLSPVGRGPSSKTWPRCPLHREQCTSVRTMPKVLSLVVSTASASGAQKLGHPVPLLNLVSEANNSCPQPAPRPRGRGGWVCGLARPRPGPRGAVFAHPRDRPGLFFPPPLLIVLGD